LIRFAIVFSFSEPGSLSLEERKEKKPMSYVTRLLDLVPPSPWTRIIHAPDDASPPQGLRFLEQAVAYWTTLSFCTVMLWTAVFSVLARLYLALDGSMWVTGSSGAAVCLLQYVSTMMDPGAPAPPSLLFGMREYHQSAHFSPWRVYMGPFLLWFFLTVFVLLYLDCQDDWLASSLVYLLYGLCHLLVSWAPALHSGWKQTVGWPLRVAWMECSGVALTTLVVYLVQHLARGESSTWFLVLACFLPAVQLLFLHWRWVLAPSHANARVCDTCAMLRIRLYAVVLFPLLSTPRLSVLFAFLLWYILCELAVCAFARLPPACSWATLETGGLIATGFPLLLMLAVTRRFSEPYDHLYIDVAAQSVVLLVVQLLQGAVVCFVWSEAVMGKQREWGQWWEQVRVVTAMVIMFSAASYSDLGLNFYSR